MLPEFHVWIFTGITAHFPAGVFTTRALAETWIVRNRLSGTLTAYPIDEGAFDWALRVGVVTGRARERGNEQTSSPALAQAGQEHYHYENGVTRG